MAAQQIGNKFHTVLVSCRMKRVVPFSVVFALSILAGCHGHTAEAAGPNNAPFATPPVLVGTPDVATLAAKVKPTVVSITAKQRAAPALHFGGGEGGEMPFPFPLPFGHGGPGGGQGGPGGADDEMPARRSLGSGFIVDARGYVITNAHVVEGAETLRVKLVDDREFDAKVKGKDKRLDLALLELVGAKDLPVAALGDSEALRVGEYLVAIGNPFGLGHTVTMGILSAKGRAIGAGPYDDFLQTDASINPGNSGGPLFNLRGQVIGINTAINPNGRGIGFAIPVDALREVLPQLIAKGSVSRGRLGVYHQPVDDALARAFGLDKPHGALIRDVEPQGPADKAGLKSGDLILQVGNVDVPSNQELPRIVARHAPGEKVSIKLLRDRVQKNVDVMLDELKDEEQRGPSAPAQAPRMGLELEDAQGGGALVGRVQAGSRFSDVLRRGDVILEVNRTPVTAAVVAMRAIETQKATILLKVRRGEMIVYLAVD